jgi:hypothetical protein
MTAFVIGAALAGCSNGQKALSDQRAGVTSVTETAILTANGWLSGSLSSTYVLTSLDRMAQLLADQRAQVAVNLHLLATREGQTLSQSEERLARTVALLADAVNSGDADAVRDRLRELQADRSRP